MSRFDRIATAGRCAVVTGAALGIGRALCTALAARGMRVIAVDVDEAELAGLAGVERHGADVADPLALADLAREVGPVDLLVNNAATRVGRGFEADLADWRRAMDVNLWGVIHGVQAFLPAMTEGIIVNVGSKQGITNPPGHPIYNMTKAALKTYTEALEHDLRRAGRVSAHLLVPGWTTTGHDAPKPGAWTPAQVVERLFAGLAREEFYIICPDGEVTEDMDRRRIAWGAGDLIEGRPPLSRWHPDWKDTAAEACS